jgi:hypothetical protein
VLIFGYFPEENAMNPATDRKEISFLQKTSDWTLDKLEYFFGTFKGQIYLTVLYELVIISFLFTFSKPVVEILGSPLLPIYLDPSQEARFARIVMLYHSLAVPFIGAVVLFILETYDVRPRMATYVKWILFPGYMVVSLSAIVFAYISHEWIFHGLFIFGLSVVFVAGLMFLAAVIPTKSFPSTGDREGVPFVLGINLEQFNIALVTFCIIISVIIGAITGSYFGQGFETFLAEYVVRLEHDLFERMIIAHLHIMVALLDTAVMLLVFRYVKMKGKWYKIAMILTIPGVIIMSVGSWLVIPDFEQAHMVINVGAMFLLLAALILVGYGWTKTSKRILGPAYETASKKAKAIAVLKDPVNFGLYFQFIWVNVVVTLPGVYLAINLRRIFRTIWPEELERGIAIGHWHVLATLTAVIVVLLAADYFNISGKSRQAIGWLLTIGSVIAFGFVNLYMFRTPGTNLDWTLIVTDIGITLMIIGISIFCLHQLIAILFPKMMVIENKLKKER